MNGIGFVWDAKARALRVQPDYARRAVAMFTHGYGYLMVPDSSPPSPSPGDPTPHEREHVI